MKRFLNYFTGKSTRFLNVEYKGISARIDTKGVKDLSQVQEKVKAAFQITVGYPQIQFYDQEDKQIDDLDDIPQEYYIKTKEGGLVLNIKLLSTPASSRQLSQANLAHGMHY